MNNIISFIESNLVEFNSLENSEVCEFDISVIDSNSLDYLIKNYRFDYKGICVYLVDSEIWVENMLS